MNHSALSFALASVLLASACAGNADRQAADREALLGAQVVDGRGCTVSELPETLPAVDAMLDSAALAHALAELGELYDLQGSYALLTLGFDRDGTNIQRDVIAHDLPDAVAADSIQRLVFRTRRVHGEADEPWGARLRLDLAEETTMEVGRRQICEPRPTNLQEVNRRMSEYMHRYGFRRGSMNGQASLHIFVDESGRASQVRIDRPSGRGMDRLAYDMAYQLSFRPASEDGVPVGAWTRVRLGGLMW